MQAVMPLTQAGVGGRAWDVSIPSCSHGGDTVGWSPRTSVRSGRAWTGLSKPCGFLRRAKGLHVLEDLLSFTTPSQAGRQRQAGGVSCSLTKSRQPDGLDVPENLEKEPHKYFDQVLITVRAGDGGNGAIFNIPQPKLPSKTQDGPKKPQKKTAPLKRGSNGEILLPMGGHGGDVVIYADESVSTLLEFHKKRRHNAKRGSNVDAMGKQITSLVREGVCAPALRIPVPVGTVVKKKRGGKLLADLAFPGEEILVARGGHGGISILDIPKSNRTHLRPVNAPTMTDPEDKALTLGTEGEEIALELTMRVVADLGLVGLPNAGKSSLLAAVTRAKPDIADYPFTTLMPNLGRLDGDPEKDDGGLAMGATMADLPGLIKDAHLGKGLGRMFLRHLRRTKLLIHIVDAAAPDPVEDYRVLREELRMYNPEYVRRPHIVLLNKIDLTEAKERYEDLRERILTLKIDASELLAAQTKPEAKVINGTSPPALPVLGTYPDSPAQAVVDDFPPPLAVLGISARQGLGVEDFLKEVRQALRQGGLELHKKERPEPRLLYKSPTWRL